MKTKLTIALVALITSSAFAAIPKVLPEFKNEKQLAEWREEMAAKHAATTSSKDDPAFYTGKPYIESTGSYAFKYRSYNAELARWTSEDPSGFPDGANSNIYSPCPSFQIDWLGLAKLDADGGAALFSKYYDYDNYTPLEAYERAGGWLLQGHLDGTYVPSCAVRLSIGLNESGNIIPAGPTANLCEGERYIISAGSMESHLSKIWGKSDRVVATNNDIGILMADLHQYTTNLGKTVYAVVANNGHVGMVSSMYVDEHFGSLYQGNYKVWILE